MGRLRTSLLAAVAAVALPLAAAPAAHADAFSQIFKEYQGSGRIDACKHSEKELKQANSSIPNDIDAYAPDFRNALQVALEIRAGGACAKAAPGAKGDAAPAPAATPSGGNTPPAPGSTVTPSPTPDPTPAPAARDEAIARTADAARSSDAGTPAPVVALGVLGALLALGGLLYALAHWLAFDPAWAQRTRHAIGEAGWRAGNTWSEFADWVRLGR